MSIKLFEYPRLDFREWIESNDLVIRCHELRNGDYESRVIGITSKDAKEEISGYGSSISESLQKLSRLLSYRDLYKLEDRENIFCEKCKFNFDGVINESDS